MTRTGNTMVALSFLPADTPAELTRLLREAPPAEVVAALAALDELPLTGAAESARRFAAGALALREGRLNEAFAALDEAAEGFLAAGENPAAALARCEAWLAAIRRGPRKVYKEAIAALEQLAAAHCDDNRVWVVAAHYRATALRYSGQAEATLEVLLAAFERSDGLLVERAQVLNSLGTLYVVLGAYGAAQTVLAHAAELNHQIGDRVSEAISYGQLGSAAMACGRLEAARKYLQRQEWFASRVGDVFGQSRALVLLADLAIDMGRYDDAVELAEQARTLAGSVEPPLAMWMAYASRSIGRAKIEMAHPDALDELKGARERFAKMGNQLGAALVGWDLARTAQGDHDEAFFQRWHQTAWRFATLGLTARVAQVLLDLRDKLASDSKRAAAVDLAIAAASQSYPHLSDDQEVALVLSQPETVARIATRKIGGQRNLGRLAAQTLARGGLHIAVIVAAAIGSELRAIPGKRCAATLVGQIPGAAIWAWSADVGMQLIARDLSSLRVVLGEDTKVRLGWFPEAHIAGLPFAGELGVQLSGADMAPHLAAGFSLPNAALDLFGPLQWDGEAEALARMSGFLVSKTSAEPSSSS